MTLDQFGMVIFLIINIIIFVIGGCVLSSSTGRMRLITVVDGIGVAAVENVIDG